MTQQVSAAVLTRWNGASLNTSIAELYQGDPGSPAAQALPRAQFTLVVEDDEQLSRGSVITLATVRFQVWNRGASVVGGYLDSIRDAYRNSHRDSVANPLVVAGAKVTNSVLIGSGFVVAEPDDAEIYQGVVHIEIRWTETNSTPS